MTQYRWAKGYHAPTEIKVEQIVEALESLTEPTPTALFEASKKTRHVLHSHLWAEGDQVWADKARREECRHIIGGVRAVYDIGGIEITVRAIEFLREDGENRWAHIETIVADKTLHDAYMAEIERLQEQAMSKLKAFRMLLKENG